MSSEMAENVNSILSSREKVRQLSKKYENQYSKEDIRWSIFNDLDGVLLHSATIYNILAFCEKGLLNSQNSKALFGFDINDPDYVFLLQNTANYEKIFFAVLVNFNIENFLKIILQQVQNKNPPNGFYVITKQLLTELQIPDLDEKLNILNTLARIRNALHSHGVHTQENISSYTIGTQTFEFIKNQEINCATWDHILLALEAVINIVDEIVQHPKVNSLKNTIHWQFQLL